MRVARNEAPWCAWAVTGGRLFGSVLLTLLFPGFGQGLAFRRTRMLVLALGTIAATIAVAWSVWLVPVTVALRLGATIDAYVLLRRQPPPSNGVLAAIALVIGAVSGGAYKVAVEGFKIPSSSMYPTLVIGDHIMVDKVSLRWHPPERGEVIVFMQPCANHAYVKRVIAVGGDTVEVRCNVVYVNGEAIASDLVADKTTYSDYVEYDDRWDQANVSRYRERHGGHTYEVFHDAERPARDKLGGGAEVHDFPRVDLMIPPSCRQSEYFDTPAGSSTQPTGRVVMTKPGAAACEQQAHFVVPADSLFVMGDNRSNANDSRYWGAVSVDAVIGRVIGIWLSAPPGGSIAWDRFGALE